MEELYSYGYFGLFIASFLAATILPVGSEPLFIGLIVGGLDYKYCIIIASLGNWMGGMTNYYLGKFGKIEWIERYLKISHNKIQRMQNFLKGKGAAMAFFSFLPIIGDVLAIALGYMQANVIIVNISMFLGKFMRYVILAYMARQGALWLW